MSIIMSLVIVLIEALCGVIFFAVFMPRKNVIRNRTVEFLAEAAVLTALIFLFFNCIKSQVTQKILIGISCVLVAHLFHDAKLYVKVGVSVLYHMKIFIVDYFAIYVICICFTQSAEEIMENPSLLFFPALLSKFILFINVFGLEKIMSGKRSYFGFVSIHFWIIFAVQSFTSVLALISIIKLSFYTVDIPLIAGITTLGVLFLNMAVAWSLRSIAHLEKGTRENALIRQEVEMELDNIKILTQTFNTQRQFMHEYNNQINTLYHLMDSGKYTQALDFIKPLSEQICCALYRIKTDHDIIDAVLNQKDIQAKENGIDINVRSGDLSMITIPDNLLVTIIGNVLDNAIEACMNIETGKVISVKLVNEDGILIFSVINPVNAPVPIVDNFINTTKEDKTVHGIGLKNVALALSQCNGDYELYCDNHFFQFTAFIRLLDYWASY